MKWLNLIKYLFPLIGVGLLVGAIIMAVHVMTFVDDAVRAEGTVVELVRSRSRDSITYAPVVRFTTGDGKSIEFQSSTSNNPPAYSRGERVSVLYQPDSPYRAKIEGFFSLWGGPLILSILGSAFLLVGGAMIVRDLRSRRRREYLRSHGIGIDTDLQGVERNTAFKLSGRSPFRVFTQWQNPSTGKIHVFKSDNVWFDPSAYVGDRKIRVLIEHGNPRRYHVDLSFLPKMAQ